MAVSVSGAIDWAQEHPVESVVIGAGGLIFVLWLFGAFSKGGGSGDSAAQGMVAAYYAAEAQQAVVGGQIQVANIAATRDTAIAGLTTDAATKIAKTQANAAKTINSQNAGVSIANINAGLEAVKSSNATAAQIADSANKTSILQTFMNSILPAEFATYGAAGIQTSIPGLGVFTTGIASNPNAWAASGYTPEQIRRMTGG